MNFFKIILILIIGSVSLSQSALAQEGNNCHIYIRTQNKQGIWKKQTVKTQLDSKTQCHNLARIHLPIFTPNRVNRKKVTFRYFDRKRNISRSQNRWQSQAGF